MTFSIDKSLRLKDKDSIFIHLSKDCPGGSIPGNRILVIIEVAYLRSNGLLGSAIMFAF